MAFALAFMPKTLPRLRLSFRITNHHQQARKITTLSDEPPRKDESTGDGPKTNPSRMCIFPTALMEKIKVNMIRKGNQTNLKRLQIKIANLYN
ncbi:hypothetical protein OWV82_005191 [Melia azedarach]|uniref:Uncharacterized protein n=1 Tax=Melia azedarach TaxID=155640 RepID=A0ACC1YSS2_MELAZ|nr:hypothetical protein OWV82_005191 [Melia azedarach]